MVPSLSAQNIGCIKIGKDFMVSHDQERRTWSKPPHGGGLEVEDVRLG
jgi:hypothetical protein